MNADRVANDLINGVVGERDVPGVIEQKALIGVVVDQVVGRGIRVELKANTDGVAIDGVAVDGGIACVNTVTVVVVDAIVVRVSAINADAGGVVVNVIVLGGSTTQTNPRAGELSINGIAAQENIARGIDSNAEVVMHFVVGHAILSAVDASG